VLWEQHDAWDAAQRVELPDVGKQRARTMKSSIRYGQNLIRAVLGVAFCMSVSLSSNTGAMADELMDAKALILLKRVTSTLSNTPAFSFRARTFFDDFEVSGVKFKRHIEQYITVTRPNKLRFQTFSEDGPTREGWYDGKILTIAVPSKKVYAQIDAPPTLDELIDLLQEKYGVNLPIADLLYSDLQARLVPLLMSGIYYGERSVAGRSLDHVSFETTPADIQLWIDRSNLPLPQRLIVNYIGIKGAPEYLVQCSDWSLGPYVSDHVFSFEPSEGWRKVEMPTR
jgi:hypothetical protein